MRLRAALTSLLTAILLCVSCSASTCAVNCELNGLRFAVHASNERGSSVEKAVSDHCGHVAGPREEQRIAEVGQGTQIGQQCGSSVCCHDQVDVVTNSGSVFEQSEQSAAIIVRAVEDLRLHAAARLPYYDVADSQPHAPPRHFDVLRV